MVPIEQLSTIAHRYEIVGTLDLDETAVVYQAVDRRLGRTVAVKVMRSADPDPATHGARLLSKVDHLDTVRVYDGGFHEGRPFIVTELVPRATDVTLETPLDTTLQLPVVTPEAPSGIRHRHHRRWWAVALAFALVVASVSAIGVWRTGDQSSSAGDPAAPVSEPTATTTSAAPPSTPVTRPATTTTRAPEPTTTTTPPKGRGGKPGKGAKPR